MYEARQAFVCETTVDWDEVHGGEEPGRATVLFVRELQEQEGSEQLSSDERGLAEEVKLVLEQAFVDVKIGFVFDVVGGEDEEEKKKTQKAWPVRWSFRADRRNADGSNARQQFSAALADDGKTALVTCAFVDDAETVIAKGHELLQRAAMHLFALTQTAVHVGVPLPRKHKIVVNREAVDKVALGEWGWTDYEVATWIMKRIENPPRGRIECDWRSLMRPVQLPSEWVRLKRIVDKDEDDGSRFSEGEKLEEEKANYSVKQFHLLGPPRLTTSDHIQLANLFYERAVLMQAHYDGTYYIGLLDESNKVVDYNGPNFFRKEFWTHHVNLPDGRMVLINVDETTSGDYDEKYVKCAICRPTADSLFSGQQDVIGFMYSHSVAGAHFVPIVHDDIGHDGKVDDDGEDFDKLADGATDSAILMCSSVTNDWRVINVSRFGSMSFGDLAGNFRSHGRMTDCVLFDNDRRLLRYASSTGFWSVHLLRGSKAKPLLEAWGYWSRGWSHTIGLGKRNHVLQYSAESGVWRIVEIAIHGTGGASKLVGMSAGARSGGALAAPMPSAKSDASSAAVSRTFVMSAAGFAPQSVYDRYIYARAINEARTGARKRDAEVDEECDESDLVQRACSTWPPNLRSIVPINRHRNVFLLHDASQTFGQVVKLSLREGRPTATVLLRRVPLQKGELFIVPNLQSIDDGRISLDWMTKGGDFARLEQESPGRLIERPLVEVSSARALQKKFESTMVPFKKKFMLVYCCHQNGTSYQVWAMRNFNAPIVVREGEFDYADTGYTFKEPPARLNIIKYCHSDDRFLAYDDTIGMCYTFHFRDTVSFDIVVDAEQRWPGRKVSNIVMLEAENQVLVCESDGSWSVMTFDARHGDEPAEIASYEGKWETKGPWQFAVYGPRSQYLVQLDSTTLAGAVYLIGPTSLLQTSTFTWPQPYTALLPYDKNRRMLVYNFNSGDYALLTCNDEWPPIFERTRSEIIKRWSTGWVLGVQPINDEPYYVS
eukprot:TRINITY_DN66746_c4_g1_i1.p1 TRINITY_DN66746_c4_g1~~TRINITY_DN66746_c4_g1_i1.p1  ORF type:complete len:999 (-),score=458.95 TRINITY_DN66746_c4_g1_i1:14-3010(-)